VLQISVLGPLEVRRDDAVLAVPGGRTAELLVRLALDAGQPVRAERLIEDLWGDEAVATRPNTLQSKVARLRRALGDPPVIITGDGTYLLDVAPDAVDALTVLDHAGTATGLLDAGDEQAAVDLCTSALARYRGDVLPTAGEGAWAEAHRTRLTEAEVRLVETALSARLALGPPADVVGDLEAAVDAHPFRESLWELLITALYRAGRQADALDAHQRVRGLLADELGLDPGPRLQALEGRILRQDATIDAPSGPRPLGIPPPTGNLPSLSVDLVGRDQELADLDALLGAARLVEVVGPGGIGKTALAIAAGRRFRPSAGAGIWLARLETAVTAAEVVDTLIAAVEVPGGEAALLERLRGAGGLVVLDNCEHVVDAVADLAVRLLDAAPDLRVLCTSQVPLGVEGEVVHELAPLGLDAAVELFGRRSSPARRGVADDQSVEDLCRALDGLPLAIELAAARTRTLSVEEITRRLDDRFVVLRDPTSRRPERRRALKATIGWSYDLLFPDDQRGLWALSAFAGGAPLPAVEHLLAALDVPAVAAIDVVGRLAGRSLVTVDDDGPATVRYRLLDSIRAYAREAMVDAGWADRALSAHASWYLGAAATSTAGVRGRAQADHLAFARAERANIDAALAWTADHAPLLGLDLVNGFGWAWVVLGDSRGAQRALTALAAAGEQAAPEDRIDALLLAAWIEASTDRLDLAREHLALATGLAETADDLGRQARAAYYLAYVVSHEGAFGEALDLTDRSRSLLDRLDRPWDQAANALFAARAAISAGDEARAVEAVAQVQHWLRVVEDPWLHVRREAVLGELARLQRRFDDAVLHLQRATATSDRLGFRQTEAYQVSSLGRAQCQAGDYASGVTTLETAIEKAEATGDVRMAALARVHLGRVRRAVGDTAGARVALEAASYWHAGVGGGEQAALGDCLLAALDAEAGVPDAVDRLRVALAAAEEDGDTPVQVFALDALARLATAAGETVQARRLSATADQAMTAASHFITERDRVDARPLSPVARLPSRPVPLAD